ncbi:MAG TPA: sensor histidine kinase [Planctomycetes bacterium]|nr:sensor histidine kinase [Planctomycetota bacterium]
MIDDVQRAAKHDDREREFPPLDILLVEDSVVIRTVLAGLLEKHNIVMAGDGLEAVTIMEKERFDIVLMDLQMPEMDWFEATAVIRKRETGRRTPIIAMTASATTDDRDQCRTAGMDGYIAKPILPDELRRTIERFTQPQSHSTSERAPAENLSSVKIQPSADVIDLELARRQIPGGEEGIRAMAQLLLDQCPIMMTEIQEGLTDRDNKRIQRAAHSLKGSADIFGARHVVEVARRIELAGKRGDVDGASETMLKLREQVSQLQSALAVMATSKPT